MQQERQKTIGREVSLSGRGLFSGEPATVTLGAGRAGQGITFIREQDGKTAPIHAVIQNVLKRPRRTCLKNGTLLVETVEHCMAALSGMGVDNATVRVTGGRVGELPAGDGSSRPFVELLEEAGVVEQDQPIHPLIIRQARAGFDRRCGSGRIAGAKLTIWKFCTSSRRAAAGRQIFRCTLKPTNRDEFASQIVPARTWDFRT